jgi:transposase
MDCSGLNDCSEFTMDPLQTLQEGLTTMELELILQIRTLADAGVGIKAIARQLDLAPNTVRRYLRGADPGPHPRPNARRLSPELVQLAQHLYRTVAGGNAVVVQQELMARGWVAPLRSLQRVLEPLRRDDQIKSLATLRFETEPGRQLQLDFGEKVVPIGGQPIKIAIFVATLGFSRRLFCRAFLSQRQDDWLEGLERAFQRFGGLTEEVLCDNASPLVSSHDRASGVVRWRAGFAAYCLDRGLVPRACKPYRARTKGKVERGVGYVKNNALAGREFTCLVAVHDHLDWWMDEVADVRLHGTIQERPIDRFLALERAALRPLPHPGLAVRTQRLSRKVSTDCFVDVNTVRYSVPHRFIREVVDVVVGLETVEVYRRGERIAQHRRCDQPHGVVRDPAHFAGLYRGLGGGEAAATVGVPSVPIALPATAGFARPLSEYALLVEGKEVPDDHTQFADGRSCGHEFETSSVDTYAGDPGRGPVGGGPEGVVLPGVG